MFVHIQGVSVKWDHLDICFILRLYQKASQSEVNPFSVDFPILYIYIFFFFSIYCIELDNLYKLARYRRDRYYFEPRNSEPLTPSLRNGICFVTSTGRTVKGICFRQDFTLYRLRDPRGKIWHVATRYILIGFLLCSIHVGFVSI